MPIPNLCIDIGNTLIKAALFDQEKMVEKQVFQTESDLMAWAAKQSFGRVIICSVKDEETRWVKDLKSDPLVFNYKLDLPIQNLYKTPQTLGNDRLACAVGAHALYPGKNCLVIDLGTCITYDFTTATGDYLGGSISPGLQMRFKALHHFTAKLPLLEADGATQLIGSDTVGSIRSGVVNGMKFEIEKTIEEYRIKYPDLQVIVCGGDAPFFESIIKGVIFAFPDLVLFGINHTLLHNALR